MTSDWAPDDLGVVKEMDFDAYMASFQMIMRKAHGYRDEDKVGLMLSHLYSEAA